MKGVEAHYAKLSDRLGWTITPPEATVNVLGYAAMNERRFDEALARYEAAVARAEADKAPLLEIFHANRDAVRGKRAATSNTPRR